MDQFAPSDYSGSGVPHAGAGSGVPHAGAGSGVPHAVVFSSSAILFSYLVFLTVYCHGLRQNGLPVSLVRNHELALKPSCVLHRECVDELLEWE